MATKAADSTETRSGLSEYNFIKQFHDEAYLYLDQALSLEESGQSQQALTLYEKGLRQLEQGLSIDCNGSQCNGEKWDLARMTQMKIRKMKDHVMSRLEDVSKERGGAAAVRTPEMPPSYDEACSLESNGTENVETEPPRANIDSKTYKDMIGMLEPMTQDGLPAYSEVPMDATEVFSIPNGVQIFFVGSDGSVSAPSYPTALAIFKFVDGRETNATRPPAFLQVGEWTYPLHPGQLPVLHSSYGAYLFPDTNSEDHGAFKDTNYQTRAAVGLLISDDVSASTRELFEHLMCELTALKSEKTSPTGERRFSTKLSDGIVSGAEMVSKGVVIGAEKTSELVRTAAAKLRSQMSTNPTPTPVDPRVQKGLQVAKDVTGVAVQVSGYLITQLGRGSAALGRYLAPHVRKHGSRLLTKAIGGETESDKRKADSTIDGVLEVASGGLRGFSTVYMGLEQAAKMLAQNLVAETVTTVQHRYGPQAGTSTGTALYTVGNIATTAYNVNNMGVRAVAKQAAKETGKALVYDYEENRKK